MQSDDECCNSCEEVREAYRKKGWGLTNADLIDQVSLEYSADLGYFLGADLHRIHFQYGKGSYSLYNKRA